ncbi:hypothetical protein L9F63_020694, partial [Diploptera punctata]
STVYIQIELEQHCEALCQMFQRWKRMLMLVQDMSSSKRIPRKEVEGCDKAIPITIGITSGNEEDSSDDNSVRIKKICDHDRKLLCRMLMKMVRLLAEYRNDYESDYKKIFPLPVSTAENNDLLSLCEKGNSPTRNTNIIEKLIHFKRWIKTLTKVLMLAIKIVYKKCRTLKTSIMFSTSLYTQLLTVSQLTSDWNHNFMLERAKSDTRFLSMENIRALTIYIVIVAPRHNSELWLKMNMTIFEIVISWKHESYESFGEAPGDESEILISRDKEQGEYQEAVQSLFQGIQDILEGPVTGSEELAVPLLRPEVSPARLVVSPARLEVSTARLEVQETRVVDKQLEIGNLRTVVSAGASLEVQLPLVQKSFGLKELIASLDIHPSYAPSRDCRGGGRRSRPSLKLQRKCSYVSGLMISHESFTPLWQFRVLSSIECACLHINPRALRCNYHFARLLPYVFNLSFRVLLLSLTSHFHTGVRAVAKIDSTK